MKCKSLKQEQDLFCLLTGEESATKDKKKKKKKNKDDKKSKKEKDFLLVDALNSKSEYLKNNFHDLYTKLKKSKSECEYELYFLINQINEWKKNKQKYTDRREKSVTKKYKKQIDEGYSIVTKYLKMGKAHLNMRVDINNTGLYRECKLIIEKGFWRTEILNFEPGKKMSWSKPCKLYIERLQHRIWKIEVSDKDNNKSTYEFKADHKIDRTTSILAFFFFLKYQDKKKRIGYNPTVQDIDFDHLDISVIPPDRSVNKKFLKLKPNIREINLKNDLSNEFDDFYAKGGCNYLVSVIVLKSYPLEAGYLKVRKNSLKIGLGGKRKVIQIPFKQDPKILKHPKEHRLFMINWDNKQVSILSPSKHYTELIFRSILHFTAKWNESGKRK
eukprot:Anaeramoba_flamelloidesa808205_311.p1 GENE.a808205_311~~a808205_311.p1  ORF type:complete len:386 (-),score=109.96 a808205_311:63-1220(-)